jgi:hypothetical protein
VKRWIVILEIDTSHFSYKSKPVYPKLSNDFKRAARCILELSQGKATELYCNQCKEFHPIENFKLYNEGKMKQCRLYAAAKFQKEHKHSELYLKKKSLNIDEFHKYCPGCDSVKRKADFTLSTVTKNGREPRCKQCRKGESRKRYLENRQEHNAATKVDYLRRKKNIIYDIPKFKKCQGPCQQILDIASFNKNRLRKDGHEHYCKTCKNEYKRKKYAEDPQHYRDAALRSYAKCHIDTGRPKEKNKGRWKKQNMYNGLFLSDNYLKGDLACKLGVNRSDIEASNEDLELLRLATQCKRSIRKGSNETI